MLVASGVFGGFCHSKGLSIQQPWEDFVLLRPSIVSCVERGPRGPALHGAEVHAEPRGQRRGAAQGLRPVAGLGPRRQGLRSEGLVGHGGHGSLGLAPLSFLVCVLFI